MPTYEYECESCGHGFEHFQSMVEKKLKKCPKCKKLKLNRLIGSGSGIIFKGSGFYETDYKKKETNGSNGRSNVGASEISKKVSENKTKADSKPCEVASSCPNAGKCASAE